MIALGAYACVAHAWSSDARCALAPYDTPDPTDPALLVGVVLPAEADTMREMAYVFAEEFALLGFDAARILRVFGSPFYTGAHHVFQALGEREVAAIVAECVSVWGAHGASGA